MCNVCFSLQSSNKQRHFNRVDISFSHLFDVSFVLIWGKVHFSKHVFFDTIPLLIHYLFIVTNLSWRKFKSCWWITIIPAQSYDLVRKNKTRENKRWAEINGFLILRCYSVNISYLWYNLSLNFLLNLFLCLKKFESWCSCKKECILFYILDYKLRGHIH